MFQLAPISPELGESRRMDESRSCSESVGTSKLYCLLTEHKVDNIERCKKVKLVSYGLPSVILKYGWAQAATDLRFLKNTQISV